MAARYPSGYTPGQKNQWTRGFTLSPGREAKLLFSGFIPTKKEEKKKQTKSIKKIQYKFNGCFGYIFFGSIHVACLWICLFYSCFVCLHVCAYAFKSKNHCGSAFESGASGLPYYWTPPVRVPAVIGGLAVWRQNKTKKP